jgi:hypothetical protein
MPFINSGDTLDQGRVKVNSFYSASLFTFTAGTGVKSIVVGNGTGNVAGSSYCFTMGKSGITTSSFSTVLGGFFNRSQATSSSIIQGSFNTITGPGSLIGAGSGNSISSNWSSIVGGIYNRANLASLQFVGGGRNNFALGNLGTIVNGFSNKTNGSYATVLNGNNSSGNTSFATVINGLRNGAMGSYSTVINGQDNRANATYSMVLGGTQNIAAHQLSTVWGQGGYTRYVGDFVLASGGYIADTTYNKIRFNVDAGHGNGKGYFNGGTIGSGADYAELFQWSDDNIINQDRKGYFVSLDGDKVKIGNENVIGVVSINPAVLGDGAVSYWKNMFLLNEWDEPIMDIYQTIVIPELNNLKIFKNKSNNKLYKEIPKIKSPKGIEIDMDLTMHYTVIEETKVKRINPFYDPEKTYIPRTERKEWVSIGLLGKLKVRTAEYITSKFVDVNSQGKAINGTKYPVLNIIKQPNNEDGIVQILFK